MTGDQQAIPPALLDPGELARSAAGYCAAGWSIVPAAAEGKRSLVPWKQWQTVAPDLELVERWWRRWPAANIAVVTGRLSGVVVVDIDPRHGGDRALAILEADHGDLPWTAVVETPSGGTHIYFRHPGYGIPNSAGRVGPGIDVRGDRGLALAPPSRRGLGGYRWALGGPHELPAIPNRWRKLLAPRRVLPGSAATRTALGAAQAPGGYVGALVAWLERQPAYVNNSLYWAALRAGEKGASEADCAPLVEAAVRAASQWPAEQVRRDAMRTVQSALARVRGP